MKKITSILLVLIVLLSITVQTVFAQGTLELLEARNDVGGAVIFVFRFSGDFSKNDFKGGQVLFGDMNLPMNCNIADAEEGIVQCTTSRAAAGQYVQINLAGQVFWAFVPVRSGSPGGGGSAQQTCYTIYNWAWDESEDPPWWDPNDTHCPDTTPTDGEFFNHDGWNYQFWNNVSPGYCGVPGNSETGYFEWCS
jgi:hypothetical protein